MEIYVDLVLHARARLCDSKVDGPKDKIVCEMLKRLPLPKVYEVAKLFQERFMGKMQAPDSWKLVRTEERNQEFHGHCTDDSYVEVLRNVCRP